MPWSSSFSEWSFTAVGKRSSDVGEGRHSSKLVIRGTSADSRLTPNVRGEARAAALAARRSSPAVRSCMHSQRIIQPCPLQWPREPLPVFPL